MDATTDVITHQNLFPFPFRQSSFLPLVLCSVQLSLLESITLCHAFHRLWALIIGPIVCIRHWMLYTSSSLESPRSSLALRNLIIVTVFLFSMRWHDMFPLQYSESYSGLFPVPLNYGFGWTL